ncbi:MAG: NAD(P)/FAD-dependent oxidoreductase [Verrucomicrobia bacterium]|nr:NAD(P)/FAD-dependent oxidoreductase [Verrucomicrobiota bacterium]
MEILYDVAIIGGGPAGTTAAILLAQNGRKVLLLEREKFPRFHIGESLLPYSLTALDRLGIRHELDAQAFQKFGGEVATSCGNRIVKFYFKSGFRIEHPSAYQVERAQFDLSLLNRARHVGADVHEETPVAEVSLHPDGVSLKTTAGHTFSARYLIDASGRNTLLGSQLQLKKTYPHLKKFSCYAHYSHVQREDGIDATLTRLVQAGRHWFWLIPLDAHRTSIGLVMDLADFQALMRQRIGQNTRVTPVHSAGDYSYRNSRLTGDRWILTGDAAGFIDPIFSTGVFLAIHSGEKAADILEEILQNPQRQPSLFRQYERDLNSLMDKYLRFVTAWYRPEFIEVFTTPTQRFQLAAAVNSFLAGNTQPSFALWWRMELSLPPRPISPLCQLLINEFLQHLFPSSSHLLARRVLHPSPVSHPQSLLEIASRPTQISRRLTLSDRRCPRPKKFPH